jgi:hypothetical protein
MPFKDPDDRREYYRVYFEQKGLKYRRQDVLRHAITKERLPTKRSIEKYGFSADELRPVVERIIGRMPAHGLTPVS